MQERMVDRRLASLRMKGLDLHLAAMEVHNVMS
jgi:hypothetical protein